MKNILQYFSLSPTKLKKSQLCLNDSKAIDQNQCLFQIFKRTQTIPYSVDSHQNDQQLKIEKFSTIFSFDNLKYEDIQKLAWNGIPHCIRAKTWKYLLKCASGNKIKTLDILTKKRNQYQKLVSVYLPNFDIQSIEYDNDKNIGRIIQGDIRRTLSEAKIFRNDRIQKLLTRVLYIWHKKHPASGYVQGMNDIAIPFFLTFISEYLPLNLDSLNEELSIDQLSPETLFFLQSDIYWCISKMLQAVINNYVRGFSGIQESYKSVQILLQQIDPKLYEHLMNEKVDLFCIYLRQISTFLIRIFSPKIAIRLFDTLISYQDKYPTFILYMLVAVFVKFSKKMMLMNFDELMKFFQSMPTLNCGEKQLEILISEAYVYSQLYSKLIMETELSHSISN